MAVSGRGRGGEAQRRSFDRLGGVPRLWSGVSGYDDVEVPTRVHQKSAVERSQPALTKAEYLTLLGFLAGYRGQTRDAYALDLPSSPSGAGSTSIGCPRSAASTWSASAGISRIGARPVRRSLAACVPAA